MILSLDCWLQNPVLANSFDMPGVILLQTWELFERRELVMMVDPALNGDYDAEEACRFLKIALLCTQDTPKLRPSMSTIVKMLMGKEEVDDEKITKPGLISDFMDLKVRPPRGAPEMNVMLYSTSTATGNNSGSSSANNTSYGFATFTALSDRSD